MNDGIIETGLLIALLDDEIEDKAIYFRLEVFEGGGRSFLT